MEKINVKVNQTTREVGLTRQIVGNQLENLQDELVFSFTDKFVDGQARLEYEINNVKYWVVLDKINETYTLPLNSQITSQEEVFMQLVVGANGGTFKSNVFSLYFADSINAETEAPEQYPTWLDKANEKLNQMDNINITANKVDNVATITVTRRDKTQDTVQIEDGKKGDKGDKGDIGLTGNGISNIEKVSSVGLKTNYKINYTNGDHFEYSVSDGYTPVKGKDYYTETEKQELVDGIVKDSTSEFNKNATEKTNAFNSNATTKTSQFNSHTEVKITEYNNNASDKLKSYNDNDLAKIEAYNSNANAKINELNTAGNKYDKQIQALQEKQNSTDDEVNNLTAEVSDNTEKIGLIKQEQVLQNKAIQKNVDDIIESNKDIASNSKRLKTLETNIFDSGVASGENINIKDSALAEFQEIKSSINKAQESTKGYQLFDISKVMSSPATNLINNNDNTLTIAARRGYSSYLKDYCPNLKVGESYYINAKSKSPNKFVYLGNEGSWAFGYSKVITQKMLDAVVFFYGEDGKETIVSDIVISKENNSNWEPYTGGIASPNPDYPQEINTIKENWNTISTRKNLFNGKYVNSFLYDTGGYTKEDGTSIILKCKPNQDYVITTTGDRIIAGESNNIPIFYENYNILKVQKNVTKPETIHTSNNTNYLIITVNTTFSDTIETQIEVGDKATPYEPYQAISTPNDLKGNEFLPGDNIIKRFNVEDGKYWAYLEKNSGKNILTGIEDFKQLNFSSGGHYYQCKSPFDNNGNSTFVISNNFTKKASWGEKKIGIWLDKNLIITTKGGIENIETLEQFKQWLSTHNTEVIYELENKQLIPIAPLDQMNMTYNPETNLFSSIGNIKIESKYYREFATTIRNMQIGNKTLEEQINENIGNIASNTNRIVTLENKPGLAVDTSMSDTSTNAVQNKVIKEYVDNHMPKEGNWELIETIVTKEDASFVRTKEPDGTTYNFKQIQLLIENVKDKTFKGAWYIKSRGGAVNGYYYALPSSGDKNQFVLLMNYLTGNMLIPYRANGDKKYRYAEGLITSQDYIKFNEIITEINCAEIVPAGTKVTIYAVRA